MALEVLQWIDLVLSLITVLIQALCLIILAKRRQFSPVIMLTQILIMMDFLNFTTRSVHDFAAVYFEKECFPHLYVSLVVFIDNYRWYGGLMLNTVLGLLYVISMYYPMIFRRIKRLHVYLIVAGFALPTLGISLPVVLNDGFRFYIPGFYWNYDFERVPQIVYKIIDTTLQGVCLASMLVACICLFFHIRKLPKSLKAITKTTSQPATSVTRGTEEVSINITITQVTTTWQQRAKLAKSKSANNLKNQAVIAKTAEAAKAFSARKLLGADKRLAISYIFYSFCFLASGLAFNLISDFSSLLAQYTALLVKILVYNKYLLYVITARY